MWNQDEIEGKAKKIKGKVKDKAGEALNNPEMENEGEAEQTEGNIQENIGKAKRKIEEAVRDTLRD